MKLALGLLIAGSGVVYLGKLAFGQSHEKEARAKPLFGLQVQYQSSNQVVLWKGPANANRTAVMLKTGRLVPAVRALKPLGTNSPALFTIVTNASPFPKPGLYKTEPYAGIVIVPEAYLDDRALINPAQGELNMPVVQPELRFQPLNAVGK